MALIWQIDGAQIRINGQVHVQGIYGTDKKQLDGSASVWRTLFIYFSHNQGVQYKCSARLFEFLNIGKKQI